MRRRLVGMVIVCALSLAPTRGFSDEPVKLSEWTLTMMDLTFSDQLLKEHFGGKVSEFENAFITFLDKLRYALLTNAEMRLHFWQHLEPILKTVSPTKQYVTWDQFESNLLILAESGEDFGWTPTKVLWPEEMLPFANKNFGGLYAKGWKIDSVAFFIFPANLVMAELGNHDSYYRREDLATAVVHEFLHHVAATLYGLHLLPEDFFEAQESMLGPYLPAADPQNSYEHLWIYKATEAVPVFLNGYVKWADGGTSTRPTVAWLTANAPTTGWR